jgi:hypothetical protein
MPAGWPVDRRDIGNAVVLPPGFPSEQGWLHMTLAQYQAAISTNAVAMAAYNATLENFRLTVRNQRRVQIADIKDGMRQIIQATNNLSAGQVTTALQRIARVIVILLDEEKVSLEAPETP